MKVCMRLLTIPRKVMLMLMVFVMDVRVFVCHFLMRMLVFVALRNMQPEPAPINAPATQNSGNGLSCRSNTDTTAPKKGATEK